MGQFYKVAKEETKIGIVLKLGFGESASNDVIVPDAVEAVKELNLEGGKVILLNGPASLPVGIALAHEVSHKFGVVGAWDPKMQAYVVSVSHDPNYKVGSLIHELKKEEDDEQKN
ncbi:CRISPR-associated protein Csx3 [Patescibacteria group bacterium]|nr:CRISPR-associated protein Csx3 [Patescibacteria group bacterium]